MKKFKCLLILFFVIILFTSCTTKQKENFNIEQFLNDKGYTYSRDEKGNINIQLSENNYIEVIFGKDGKNFELIQSNTFDNEKECYTSLNYSDIVQIINSLSHRKLSAEKLKKIVEDSNPYTNNIDADERSDSWLMDKRHSFGFTDDYNVHYYLEEQKENQYFKHNYTEVLTISWAV